MRCACAARSRSPSGIGRSRTHSDTLLLATPSAMAISLKERPSARSCRALRLRSSFALGRRVQAGAGMSATQLWTGLVLRSRSSAAIWAMLRPWRRRSRARSLMSGSGSSSMTMRDPTRRVGHKRRGLPWLRGRRLRWSRNRHARPERQGVRHDHHRTHSPDDDARRPAARSAANARAGSSRSPWSPSSACRSSPPAGRPAGLGRGWLGWTDVLLAVVFYAVTGHGITVGFHRYFTHGSFKAKRPLRIALAIAGQHGHRGPAGPLGGRPPQAPQVLRRGGRPALAVALRRDRARADEGPVVRPHRLAVRRRADPAAAVRAGPAQGPRHRPGHPRPFVAARRSSRSLLPAAARRPADDVLAGRAHRVLLGLSLVRVGAAAPRDLVDQLDLPRDRQAPVQDAATGPATCGGWRSCPAASPGTTCTTPTRPARGTACSGQIDSSARLIRCSRGSAGRTTSAGPRRRTAHRRPPGRPDGGWRATDASGTGKAKRDGRAPG